MFQKKKSTRELVGGETIPVQDALPPNEENKKTLKTKAASKSPVRSRTFLGGISVAAALFIAFGVTPMMDAITSDTTEALRLKDNVVKGELLTVDQLESVKVHARDFSGAVLTDAEDVLGQYAALDLQSGDVLTTKKITQVFPSDDPYLAELPDGKLAMSIAMAGSAESVSGKLRTGDIVRLYAYQNNNADSSNYQATSMPELQYLEVLAVTNDHLRDISDREEKNNQDAEKAEKTLSTLTLAVSPEQATLLSGLNNSATLHAALVVRGNAEAKEEALTRQDAYFTSTQPPVAADPQNTRVQNQQASPTVPQFSAAPPTTLTPSANVGAAQ